MISSDTRVFEEPLALSSLAPALCTITRDSSLSEAPGERPEMHVSSQFVCYLENEMLPACPPWSLFPTQACQGPEMARGLLEDS